MVSAPFATNSKQYILPRNPKQKLGLEPLTLLRKVISWFSFLVFFLVLILLYTRQLRFLGGVVVWDGGDSSR